jgi:DNA polymerase-1
LDGDIAVFKAASAVEEEIHFSDDLSILTSNLSRALSQFQSNVDEIQEELKADKVIICFSDPQRRYFRHDVLPTYKQNRSGTRKPIVFKRLSEIVLDQYETFTRPGLEGDDVLGILSTSLTVVKGEKVIVSVDKDMKSVPGLLYRDGEIITVTQKEADYNHMLQTLTGDTTDGYSGCPGVGPVGAKKILDDDDPLQWWPAVVKAFAKAGYGEEFALTQARVARILRASDYDFKKKQPILWNPPALKEE